MITHTKKPAVLLLQDGSIFFGQAHGADGDCTGELCFNTGMTGYQEIFTDPSYYNQLLVMTNVHIGNYGTLNLDEESENVQISGLICKNLAEFFHRPLASSSIEEYLHKKNLLCISEIDTRQLVHKIRNKGAMNAVISTNTNDIERLHMLLKDTPDMSGMELASRVTTSESFFLGSEDAEHRVAVLDFGTKRSILHCLSERNCYLKVFPATSKAEEIRKWSPDAYFLSNGPGDPAAMLYAVETVQELLKDKKALFGICLGHQILALALGIETYKMHHGHRGANHPVLNLETGTCEITTQNHGFGVSPEAIEKNLDKLKITHKNLNDGTIEGIELLQYPAFSVQYHPEAAPGPHDSRYLFDKFVEYIKLNK